jgi:hypothetical protein
MRAAALILITCAFIASTSARTEDGVTAGTTNDASDANDAIWVPRTLVNFKMPLVSNSENGPLVPASCDQISDTLRVLLLKLGARNGDLKVDLRGCYGHPDRSADATFYVLASPAVSQDVGTLIKTRWETVMMKGNCRFLEMATIKIVPLFTSRNVKRISAEDCARLGVGLFAEVLRER